MKLLWILFFSFFLVGATPIYNRHENENQVDEEFRNIYLHFQPKQFTVVGSTPSSTDFQNAELVIFSTGAVKLMLTIDTTVYQLIFSSIQGR